MKSVEAELTWQKLPALSLRVRLQRVENRRADQQISERAYDQRQSPDILPLHLRAVGQSRETDRLASKSREIRHTRLDSCRRVSSPPPPPPPAAPLPPFLRTRPHEHAPHVAHASCRSARTRSNIVFPFFLFFYFLFFFCSFSRFAQRYRSFDDMSRTERFEENVERRVHDRRRTTPDARLHLDDARHTIRGEYWSAAGSTKRKRGRCRDRDVIGCR